MTVKKERKLRILIADPIDREAEMLLRRSGFIVHVKLKLSREEMLRTIPRYEVLICRTNTKLNRAFFEAAVNLQCVGLASTGYDQIDLGAATAHNVAILGLPSHNKEIDVRQSGNFISTAEHTMLLILAALRNLYNASASMKRNCWEKRLFLGSEAHGKTLGIVGLGRIGTLVANRAQAFGMQVIAYDPYVTKQHMKSALVASVDFDTLCKTADIISIHAPKCPETQSLFNKRAFGLMKKGVIIVNAARAEIVDTHALLEALDSGKVTRAAIDVFTDEPVGVEWHLATHPKVIPTPHIGGSTSEALRRISLEVAHNVVGYTTKSVRTHVINTDTYCS